jgi:hypothetical protein
VDLPPGSFTITYPLGTKGEKSLEFSGNAIVVKVRHAGEFTECVPLLERSDQPASGFTVTVDPPATATRVATTTEIGRRKLVVMHLKAKDALTYRLEFTP